MKTYLGDWTKVRGVACVCCVVLCCMWSARGKECYEEIQVVEPWVAGVWGRVNATDLGVGGGGL